MMYEIRNYHFDPALFEDYKAWAKSKALPYLSNALDLVGFWTNLPEESDIIGEPMDAGSDEYERYWFIRGDANNDLSINVADAIFIFDNLFGANPPGFVCPEAANVNDDSSVDVAETGRRVGRHRP